MLDSFSQPFTALMQETMALAEKHAADKAALKVIFGSLVLIAKIFYFLNYQDLPEFFEDNMKVCNDAQTWTDALKVKQQLRKKTRIIGDPRLLF